jgi:hypothetical protein
LFNNAPLIGLLMTSEYTFEDFYGKKVGFSLGPVSGLAIKSGSASGFTSKFSTVADES